MELRFLQMNDIRYKQFKDDFVPNLSIIDVMMFCSKEQTGAKIVEILSGDKRRD